MSIKNKVTGELSNISNYAADGVISDLSVTGNVTAVANVQAGNANVGAIYTDNYYYANGLPFTGQIGVTKISNGTSNVSIPAVNGNVNISSAGNANVFVVTGTGANVTGTLSASGNANVANLGTAGVFATTLSSTGNANVGNLGTGGLITATGNVTGGNLVTAGVLTVSGTGQSSISGNLNMNSKNITSFLWNRFCSYV